MGVLDSILGMNTSAGTQAGVNTANATLNSANLASQGVLRGTTQKANDALTTNTQAGIGALNTGYGNAVDALTNYTDQAQGQLSSGVNSATGTVLGGNTNYQPFLSGGQGATSMLSNALGLNGASGNAAATSAFQTSPGYQFQLNQSTDAAERAAAAAGGLGSGSMLSAITQLGSGLANQEYGNWLSNLQGLGTQGLNAANAISSNNQTAGGYQYGGGTAGAQLSANEGQNIGQTYANQGTGTAGLFSNLGQGLSSNLTGMGLNIANVNDQMSALQGQNDVTAGAAQDQAANANSGILSKLIGGLAGLPLGGSSLSSAGTSGFSIAPGANGSFSISPSAAAGGGSSGIGLLGPSISTVGKQIASFL